MNGLRHSVETKFCAIEVLDAREPSGQMNGAFGAEDLARGRLGAESGKTTIGVIQDGKLVEQK